MSNDDTVRKESDQNKSTYFQLTEYEIEEADFVADMLNLMYEE